MSSPLLVSYAPAKGRVMYVPALVVRVEAALQEEPLYWASEREKSWASVMSARAVLVGLLRSSCQATDPVSVVVVVAGNQAPEAYSRVAGSAGAALSAYAASV